MPSCESTPDNLLFESGWDGREEGVEKGQRGEKRPTNPRFASFVPLSTDPFSVTSVTWSPDGEGLCLMDSSGLKGVEGQFALVFEVPEEDDQGGVAGMSLIGEEEEQEESVGELKLANLTGFSA